MKKQKVVRTYPRGYVNTTGHLTELLEQGYTVVMCNKFYCDKESYGNEYILEKEVNKNAM